jgi:hypothetical protein
MCDWRTFRFRKIGNRQNFENADDAPTMNSACRHACGEAGGKTKNCLKIEGER